MIVDLDAEIRRRLAPAEDPGASVGLDTVFDWGDGWEQYTMVRDALLAVLDEHRHIARGDELPDWQDPDSACYLSIYNVGRYNKPIGCTLCHYDAQGAVQGRGWCLTVRTIAQSMGIFWEQSMGGRRQDADA
jgi:hypothetical protein